MPGHRTKLLGLLIVSITACAESGNAPPSPANAGGTATVTSGTGGQIAGGWNGTAEAGTAAGGVSGSSATPAGGGGVEAKDAAPDPPVDCAGVVYDEDFETQDDAGWSHLALEEGLGDPWVHATVLASPMCHGGQSCWATGTAEAHATCQEGALVSPALDLSGCASRRTLRVSYWQYLHTEPFAEDTYFDSGRLEISGDDGATWQALPDEADLSPPYVGMCGIHDDGCNSTVPFLSDHSVWGGRMDSWSQVSFKLPAEYQTASFRLRFLFGSDFKEVRRGWVVDDLAVTVD